MLICNSYSNVMFTVEVIQKNCPHSQHEHIITHNTVYCKLLKVENFYYFHGLNGNCEMFPVSEIVVSYVRLL